MQTITFASVPSQVFDSAPFALSATASSGLAVSFASTTMSVCTVAGSTLTLLETGTCAIQAIQTGNATYAAAPSVNQSFQVTQGSQTITFGTLSSQVYGTAPFTISATVSSDLAVTFNSQTTSICTVSGSKVTLILGGTCTIQATQAGNASYNAAPPVNQSFTVSPEGQTITFGMQSSQVYGTVPFTVSATASSGLPVSFNSQTTSICTVSGSTVTLVAVGTCTIQATQAGNASYAAAPSVNQNFSVTQGSQGSQTTFVGSVCTTSTSAPVNMSGANFLVAEVTSNGAAGSLTDSSGNTWTAVQLTTPQNNQTQWGQLWYAQAAVTTATQTFTVGSNTQSVCVAGFSGMATSGVYESGTTSNNSVAAGGTAGSPGTSTPGGSSLIVTGLAFTLQIQPVSISSGFSIAANAGATGYWGGALAYLAGTAPQNPTWTTSAVNTQGYPLQVNIASFAVAPTLVMQTITGSEREFVEPLN